jgi:hypothetical protein
MPTRSSRRTNKGQPPRRGPSATTRQQANVQRPQTQRARSKNPTKRTGRRNQEVEQNIREEPTVIASSPLLVHTDTDNNPSPPPPPSPPKRRFVYEWKVIFDGEEIGAGSNPETLASSIDFEDLWYKSHRLSSDHALSRNSTYYRISTNTSIGTKGGENNSTSMIEQPEDWPSVSGIIETYQASAVRNVLIVQVTTTFSRFPDGKHPSVDTPNNLPVETIVSKLDRPTIRVSLVVDNIHIDMKEC